MRTKTIKLSENQIYTIMTSLNMTSAQTMKHLKIDEEIKRKEIQRIEDIIIFINSIDFDKNDDEIKNDNNTEGLNLKK